MYAQYFLGLLGSILVFAIITLTPAHAAHFIIIFDRIWTNLLTFSRIDPRCRKTMSRYWIPSETYSLEDVETLPNLENNISTSSSKGKGALDPSGKGSSGRGRSQLLRAKGLVEGTSYRFPVARFLTSILDGLLEP